MGVLAIGNRERLEVSSETTPSLFSIELARYGGEDAALRKTDAGAGLDLISLNDFFYLRQSVVLCLQQAHLEEMGGTVNIGHEVVVAKLAGGLH